MKNIFYNENHQLRNGWWILIFISFIAMTRPIYKPIKQALGQLGFTETMLEPVSFLLVLLATWLCLKLRKESMQNVGMAIDLRWLKQFLFGTLGGVAMMFATVGCIWLVGGVSFELDPQRNVQLLSYGFYMFLIGALFEEILHRGFIFQRLIDGIGVWGAQLLIATLFAVGHWGNPGMQGTTQLFSSLDLFLGSLIFGLAYIKTRSLALPIGLHLGWNWTQGDIFGFAVSGFEKTGWLTPEFHGMAQWLTGGDFGPEASIFSTLVSIVTLIILVIWKGKVKTSGQSQNAMQNNPITV
jgi:uncharacterized protein